MLYTPLNQIAIMIRELGFSQKVLAHKLGVSETHLSAVLNEKTEPSFKLYCQLCTRIEMYQIIDNKNQKNDNKINKEPGRDS